MRTIIDLPDPDLQAIKAWAKRNGISQAEAIRQAVRAYLVSRPAPSTQSPAFGLWTDCTDGVRYQQQMRDEWADTVDRPQSRAASD